MSTIDLQVKDRCVEKLNEREPFFIQVIDMMINVKVNDLSYFKERYFIQDFKVL